MLSHFPLSAPLVRSLLDNLYIFFKLYVTLTCHDLDLFVFRLMQTPMMMMKKKTKMILLVLATKTI